MAFSRDISSTISITPVNETLTHKIRHHCLKSFLYQHELKSLVKKKTYFKSISNPSCVYLFLTSNALSFQSTKVVSTGLSDFHKLVLTVLKTSIV